MKRCMFQLLIIILSCSLTAQGRSYYVHDLDGTLIHYSVAESLVVAKFNSSLPVHYAADVTIAPQVCVTTHS